MARELLMPLELDAVAISKFCECFVWKCYEFVEHSQLEQQDVCEYVATVIFGLIDCRGANISYEEPSQFGNLFFAKEDKDALKAFCPALAAVVSTKN